MAIQLNLLSSQQQLEEVAEVECVDGPKSPGFGECSLSFAPAHPVPPEVWRVQAGKLIVEAIKGLKRMADKSGAGGGGKAPVPKGSGGKKSRTHKDDMDEIMATGPGAREAKHTFDIGSKTPTVTELATRALAGDKTAISELEIIVSERKLAGDFLDAIAKLGELSKSPQTREAATDALVRLLKAVRADESATKVSPKQVETFLEWAINKSHPNPKEVFERVARK
jgi:hypothetical protein